MTNVSAGANHFSSSRSSIHHSKAGVLETRRWIRSLLLLTLATSSLVLIEPAPYDCLVLAMLGIVFLLGLRIPHSLNVGLVLLCLFVIGNLIGALTAGYTADGIRSLSIRLYLVLSWLLFASLAANDARGVIRTIWTGYSIAALLAVVTGILQFYGYLPGEFSGSELRATGPFKDPNVFAPFLIPVALLAVPRLLVARGLTLLRDVGWLLLLVFGIFLAFSRGAWLNFATSLSLLALFLALTSSHRHALKLLLAFVVIGLLATVALVWVIKNTTAGQMFEERTSLVQDYDVAEVGRFSAQLAAIREIGVSPLGVGPGMSPLSLGMAPHNVYLHVALEAGWLGALSMYLFLLVSLWRGFRQLKWATGALKTHTLIILVSVLGILLQSFFIDSTHWRHLWLLLAMLWGITTVTQDDRPHAHTSSW